MNDNVKYQIIDNKTGQPVGRTYDKLRSAKRRADKLDLQYGAVRYIVRRVSP